MIERMKQRDNKRRIELERRYEEVLDQKRKQIEAFQPTLESKSRCVFSADRNVEYIFKE